MKRRILFDSSALIGAILRQGSVPDQALHEALNGYQLCTSMQLLDELTEALRRRRFDRYASLESRLAFAEMVRHFAVNYVVPEDVISETKPRCRDFKDQHILGLAKVAEVAIIVSSDKDLLDLHPWNGIPILTPAQFLAQSEI